MKKNHAVQEILFHEKALQNRCKELAKLITEDYHDKHPILVCTLKGAYMFFAELTKNLDFDLSTEFIKASSYIGTNTTGNVVLSELVPFEIKDKDILIVEDIVDSGLTMHQLMEYFKSNHARSIEIVCLLNKQSRRKVELSPKYVGYDIPDHFVVGFGLDYNEKYRNLPYIGILDPKEYQ